MLLYCFSRTLGQKTRPLMMGSSGKITKHALGFTQQILMGFILHFELSALSHFRLRLLSKMSTRTTIFGRSHHEVCVRGPMRLL